MAMSEGYTSRTLRDNQHRRIHQMRQIYQNEHTLLVSLLSGLLLMVVGFRQGLVYGCHCDIRVLWMCWRCLLRLQKKFENI
jgi:hypothetical protein